MNVFSFLKKVRRKFDSDVSGAIYVEEYAGKKTLYMNSVPQSGGEFEYMWRKVIEGIEDKKITSCLVLGVGGATALVYLTKKYPELVITAVELDPVIVHVQKKYFPLKKGTKMNLICADAFKWVEGPPKSKFDLIIVDLYHNRLNPQKARTPWFMEKVKRLLSQNGKIIFNAHYQPEKPRDLEAFLSICKEKFTYQKEVFKYKYNRVILLSNI